jgi:hypothetical protein
MLQKAISSRHVQPTAVQGQRHAIIEEYAQILHHKVGMLISSMRRGCQAVINARGNQTRYQTPYANHFLICRIFFIQLSDLQNVQHTLSATSTRQGTLPFSFFPIKINS